MSHTWKSRLTKLEAISPTATVVIVHNALPPSDGEILPNIGEPFSSYKGRVISSGTEQGLACIIVSAWYDAENQPFDGNWIPTDPLDQLALE